MFSSTFLYYLEKDKGIGNPLTLHNSNDIKGVRNDPFSLSGLDVAQKLATIFDEVVARNIPMIHEEK